VNSHTQRHGQDAVEHLDGKRLLETVLHAWLPSTMMETVYRKGSWEQQKRQSRARRAANGRRLKSAESLN
jgi:hypothetical protein